LGGRGVGRKDILAIVAALSNVVRNAHRDHTSKSAHGMNLPPRISDHPPTPAAPSKSSKSLPDFPPDFPLTRWLPPDGLPHPPRARFFASGLDRKRLVPA
jgi:hypothetical protein